MRTTLGSRAVGSSVPDATPNKKTASRRSFTFTLGRKAGLQSPKCSHRPHRGNGLPDAPKDAGGINKHEVTYTPWPVFRWIGFRIVLGCDSLSLDVMPPCIHIRDEQMHHEVASVHLVIEILEQK